MAHYGQNVLQGAPPWYNGLLGQILTRSIFLTHALLKCVMTSQINHHSLKRKQFGYLGLGFRPYLITLNFNFNTHVSKMGVITLIRIKSKQV
jgi:hypothetical protein